MTDRLAKEAVGGKIIGVDSNLDILPCTSATTGVQFVHGHAGALPFASSSFDFIYARFLLQHVTSPQEIVNDAASKLTTGGTLTIMDTDDTFFTMDPLDRELDNLLNQAREFQEQLGGNRHVGRKIPTLIAESGLTIQACRVRVFNSVEMPFEILFRLATGFKAALLGKMEQFNAISERLRPCFRSKTKFMTAGIVIATGSKIE
jgi:SAM-dependent methyltransferase